MGILAAAPQIYPSVVRNAARHNRPNAVRFSLLKEKKMGFDWTLVTLNQSELSCPLCSLSAIVDGEFAEHVLHVGPDGADAQE